MVQRIIESSIVARVIEVAYGSDCFSDVGILQVASRLFSEVALNYGRVVQGFLVLIWVLLLCCESKCIFCSESYILKLSKISDVEIADCPM